ncbi:MAG: PDDEXK nuclease domain-containing protein [Gemmataceae bacterium]|nr:PDDEXK nuclease domain-containing protein [Gemmataceae bacterium]
MSKRRTKKLPSLVDGKVPDYDQVLEGVVHILEQARRASARAVNAFITSTYWEIGRRIVEYQQGGTDRAEYGSRLLKRLANDLTSRFGRGFSERNLEYMRLFYLGWPIPQTSSAELPSPGISQTLSAKSPSEQRRSLQAGALSRHARFPLPWSHYVLLLKVEKPQAREYYEAEALRNGWTVRQLDRQITTLFYERTLASRNKAAMLKKGAVAKPGEILTPEEEIKDPLILEFLGLKDEYSESDLEEALIRQLESFLLELGGDFAFVGRQRRLRIGDEWYRLDLLFFHRRLRCLVVIDLKLGKFTHADAGQMHLYLRYASRHWTNPGENPPVGLILCAHKDEAVARYALDDLPNKVLAAQYRLALPDERTLEAELARTRRLLENRRPRLGRKP